MIYVSPFMKGGLIMLSTYMIALALICMNNGLLNSQSCQKHLARCMLEKRSDNPDKDLLQCVAEGRMN